jgi:hypothetical protein
MKPDLRHGQGGGLVPDRAVSAAVGKLIVGRAAPETMTHDIGQPLHKPISRLLRVLALIALAVPVLVVVLGLTVFKTERYKWRTINQWLRLLALEPGRAGSPLDITRVHVSTNLHTVELSSGNPYYSDRQSLGLARVPERTIEVPLSYDAFREHKALGRAGYFNLLIDGDPVHTELLRGTNGSCLIPLPEYMPPGPHQVAVEFVIRAPGHGSKIYLHARGSERAIAFGERSTSH